MTNACGAYFVTRQDSQHLALYHDAARTGPVAGNGVATFSSPATRAFAVIPITSVAISGNTVTVTIGYDPGAGNLTSAYAMTAEGWGTASANFGTGGFPSGRCGLLRDSDRMTDILGRRQYNWACSFLQAGL